MSRVCSLCAKKTSIGRNRSHAQNRTARTFRANIQKVTIHFNETIISGDFCSKCLKKLKKETSQKPVTA